MTPRTEKKNTATSFVHFGGVSALLGVAWGMAMPGRGRRKRTAASKPCEEQEQVPVSTGCATDLPRSKLKAPPGIILAWSWGDADVKHSACAKTGTTFPFAFWLLGTNGGGWGKLPLPL